MVNDMLIDEIRSLQQRLEVTRNHFDNASDEEEITSLIYEEKAYMLRLSYLIRLAKQGTEGGALNG